MYVACIRTLNYVCAFCCCISKGGLTTKVLQFATTTATSKICSQLQLLLLLNKSSSLLTTATALKMQRTNLLFRYFLFHYQFYCIQSIYDSSGCRVTFNVSRVNTKTVFVSNAEFSIINFDLHNTIIGFRNYCQLKLPSLAGIYLQQS